MARSGRWSREEKRLGEVYLVILYTGTAVRTTSRRRQLDLSCDVGHFWDNVTSVPIDQRVEVRRSSRRRRAVSVYRSGARTVVLLPDGLSHAEEQRWVDFILQRLRNGELHRHPSNTALQTRALELAERYLDGRVRPTSVQWVDDPAIQWGTCTPANGEIRVSYRLAGMPGWVLDYVLMYELAHLIVRGHGPEFWTLVHRYPHSERAQGYLEGFTDARRLLTEERARSATTRENESHARG